MAVTYYAVATGNFNATTVWSLSSGGVVTPAAPGASDTAIFDANTGAHTVTLTGATSITTLTMTGSTGTLAFAAQTLTVSNGATLAGAMTSTSGTLLITGGGVTLSGTPTGTFPKMEFTTASQTLTSGGFTWPGAMQFNFIGGTFTLSGNWINTGLLTNSVTTVLNWTTNESFTTNGGYTNSGGLTGTATLILGGGTWSGSGTLSVNTTLAGNVTLSGTNLSYTIGTFTYSSGTITSTGSNINISGNPTLNLNGTTLNSITIATTPETITLSSDLSLTSLINSGLATTISGAHNITVGTYTQNSPNTNTSLTIPAGQTLNVTTALNMKTGNATNTLQSGTSSSSIFLNYTGTLANENVSGMIFTDVNANGSGVPIYNYGGSTLTRTSNIYNVTAANINNGFFIQ